MVADEVDYVIGVDTHRDEHVLAGGDRAAGRSGGTRRSCADGGDYREALRFAERYAVGRGCWAIEGGGSYGAGLARALAGCGEVVLKLGPHAEIRAAAARQERRARRGRGGAGGAGRRDARAAAQRRTS